MFGDCHIHMVLDGVYYRDAIAAHRGHVRDDLIRQRLADYAARGVRFLRDGGDAFGVCGRARELALEYGIDYRSPVFPICMEGRYGAFIGRTFATMAEYRALIGEVKRRGGDFVKLMISGIMDFEQLGRVTSEPLTREQLFELIRVAHGEGFAVMAHANGAETILNAVEAGADSIEHGAYMDAVALRALAESRAVWVPTLATLGNLIGDGRYPDGVLSRILDLQLENAAEFVRLGGALALGSDAGAYRVLHGQGAEDEYRLLARAVGSGVDAALQKGEDLIRKRFGRA